MRTGNCRRADNCQKDRYDAKRSRPSSDEVHEHRSWFRSAGRPPRRQAICAFGHPLPQAVAASRSIKSAGPCSDARPPHQNHLRRNARAGRVRAAARTSSAAIPLRSAAILDLTIYACRILTRISSARSAAGVAQKKGIAPPVRASPLFQRSGHCGAEVGWIYWNRTTTALMGCRNQDGP